ncbi:MAG: hypothetical protein ACYS21_21075, partial [Planctomycetota bacterium]
MAKDNDWCGGWDQAIEGLEFVDRKHVPPDPVLPQTLVLRNGTLDDRQEPGEIPIEIVSMSPVSVSPIELHNMAGPEPLTELRPDGVQVYFPWIPVLDACGVEISLNNPIPLPADRLIELALDPTGRPIPVTQPKEPIHLDSGDFLLARQQIRFTNNSGQEDCRWVSEIHEAHEAQFDLGDAPNSSNSHGAAMTACPWGVMANYPMVYVAGS